MAVDTQTDTDLAREVATAEAEVSALETAALAAKPAELGKLASALALARATLDIAGRRHKAAVAARQAEQATREAAERAEASAIALSNLRARVQAANDRWAQWATRAEELETGVKSLWSEYDALQAETRSIAETDAILSANLVPTAPGPVASAFVERCRGRVHAIAFGPDVRRGLSPRTR